MQRESEFVTKIASNKPKTKNPLTITTLLISIKEVTNP
jgi:hypothetical protein